MDRLAANAFAHENSLGFRACELLRVEHAWHWLGFGVVAHEAPLNVGLPLGERLALIRIRAVAVDPAGRRWSW